LKLSVSFALAWIALAQPLVLLADQAKPASKPPAPQISPVTILNAEPGPGSLSSMARTRKLNRSVRFDLAPGEPDASPAQTSTAATPLEAERTSPAAKKVESALVRIQDIEAAIQKDPKCPNLPRSLQKAKARYEDARRACAEDPACPTALAEKRLN
jgi:hypothetical protein